MENRLWGQDEGWKGGIGIVMQVLEVTGTWPRIMAMEGERSDLSGIPAVFGKFSEMTVTALPYRVPLLACQAV